MKHGISYGVTYPEREDFSDAAEYASTVEDVGFDSLWMTDNIASRAVALEPLTTLAFMAAHTSRLYIGTSVLLLPLRNPVLLCRMINSIDLLSSGRVILGVGVGGPGGEGSGELDFEAYGGDVRTRGARSDEALEILRQLWCEAPANFVGAHHRVTEYEVRPSPQQEPHPPIWVGGHVDRSRRRAGRWGAAYIPGSDGFPNASLDEWRALYDRVDSYASEFGRQDIKLTRALHIYMCLADTQDEAWRTASQVLAKNYQEPITLDPDGPYLFGSPDRCMSVLEGFINIGVTHFVFNVACEPERSLEQVEYLGRQILHL